MSGGHQEPRGPAIAPPPLSHRVKWHVKRLLHELDPRLHRRARRHLQDARPCDVVICLPSLVAGGVERLVLNLVHALTGRGWRVGVLVTADNDHIWLGELPAGVRVVALHGQVPPYRHVGFVAAYVRRSTARCLLITNSQPAYDALPRLDRRGQAVRKVDLLHTPGRPVEQDAFLRSSLPVAARLDARILVSDFLRSYLVERGYAVGQAELVVVPNAVPPPAAELSPRPPGCRVLWLGRLEVDKDPLAVVGVARALHALEPHARLSVAGGGPLAEALEASLREAGLTAVVRLLGHVADVGPLLADHDVLLNTSPLEGQPLAVLEALASGMPVVAYAVGGLVEMATTHRHLHLVPPELGPDGLARAVADVLFRGERGEAREEADERWLAHVEAYERVLGLTG